MKKRLALLTVIAAGAVAYTALKNKKKIIIEEDVDAQEELEVKPIELPSLPKKSKLSSALLESYRVQCQVMMDGYPEEMKIDLIHHIDVSDSSMALECADKLKAAGYQVEENIEHLSLHVVETIDTSAQMAFDHVVKMAELAQKEKAMYQGWILDNCR